MGLQLAREVVELALGAPPLELSTVDGADTGRVIAAILKPLQAIEQPLRDCAPSHDSNNSAHDRLPG